MPGPGVSAMTSAAARKNAKLLSIMRPNEAPPLLAADHADDLPGAGCVLAVAEHVRAERVDRLGRHEADLAGGRHHAHEILARVRRHVGHHAHELHAELLDHG